MHSFNSKTLKPWLSADGWEKRGDSNLWVSIRIYLSGWCSTLFLLLICSLFGRENDHTLTHLLITKHRPVIKSCKYTTSPKNGSNIFPIGKSLVNIIQSITTRINHDSKSRGIWYISNFSNLPKPLRSENGRFVTKILHRYKQNMINDICT